MRIARVLDASDPRVQSTPPRRTRMNPDRRERSPEKQLLIEVNRHEGPLTSIDRVTLRGMGITPWDEVPGYDGQTYAEAHGVTEDDLYREYPEDDGGEREVPSVTDRLLQQHRDNVGRHTPPPPGMTEPQERLIENRLLPELQDIDPVTYGTAFDWYRDQRAAGTMTKKLATRMIKRLKHHCGYEEDGWNKRADFRVEGHPDREMDVPVKVDAKTPVDYFEDIPDAYYALRDPEGTVKFYRVSTFKRCLPGQSRPNRKVQRQASDELHPVKANVARMILREIREMKPRESAFLYGREIGRCCRCGRTLTDETSRSMGIGPDCASKSW